MKYLMCLTLTIHRTSLIYSQIAKMSPEACLPVREFSTSVIAVTVQYSRSMLAGKPGDQVPLVAARVQYVAMTTTVTIAPPDYHTV